MSRRSPASLASHAASLFARGGIAALAVLLLSFAPAHAQVLSDFTLNPISVEGGNTVTGTVTLDAPAPSGGVTIDLYSDNPGAATLPQNVVVAQGQTTADFQIDTPVVTEQSCSTLYATQWDQGVQVFRLLFVSPLGSTELQMALTFTPGSVSGGAPVTGNVYLGRVAPIGGTTVSLYSYDVGLATVPASVTVPEGAATVSFPVQTVAVPSNTYNAFSASCEGVTVFGFLWFDAALPDAPLGLTATPRSHAVKLSWDAVKGVGRYNIKVANTPSDPYVLVGTIVVPEPPETGQRWTFDDLGLTNGEDLYYIVSAVNDAGEGPDSDYVVATPTLVAPRAPTDLTVAGGDGKALLIWEDAEDAAEYRVQRATGTGAFQQVGVVTDGKFTDTGLTNGVVYRYTVSASNSAGDSPDSNEVIVEPAAPVLTEAQAIAFATTFCQTVGATLPPATVATAQYPVPPQYPGQPPTHYLPCWRVNFGDDVFVDVIDRTATSGAGGISKFVNMSLVRTLFDSEATAGTSLPEADAVQKAQDVITASGLSDTLSAPVAVYEQSTNDPALEAGQTWTARLGREYGSVPYERQQAVVVLQAGSNAVESFSALFPAAPPVSMTDTLTEAQAVTAAETQLTASGVTGVALSGAHKALIQTNTFWQANGNTRPAPGPARLAWVCRFTEQTGDLRATYVLYIAADTGDVVGGELLAVGGWSPAQKRVAKPTLPAAPKHPVKPVKPAATSRKPVQKPTKSPQQRGAAKPAKPKSQSARHTSKTPRHASSLR